MSAHSAGPSLPEEEAMGLEFEPVPFIQAPVRLVKDVRVSAAAVRLYLVLMADRRPGAGTRLRSSRQALASALSISEQTVLDQLTELVATGWLREAR